MNALTFFNTLAGAGTLIILITVISLWVLIFIQETNNHYFQFIKKHGFHFAFLLSLVAVLGSLTYSELFKFPPCTFCWWQRIFMYPQTVVLAIGIYLKDIKIWLTSIILSIIGAGFSIYHILLQTGIRASGAPCEALGGVACTKIDVIVFGWITIPIMCLTLFIGILTLAYVAHKKTA